MGYQIIYSSGKHKKSSGKKRLLAAVLVLSLGAGTLLHPTGRELMGNLLLSSELRELLPAAETMAAELKNGETFRNAWEAFCITVFHEQEAS